MENKLKIFKNQEFGSVRILQEGEKYLFCAKDVTAALGYKDSVNAIKRHCKGVAKRHLLTEGGPQELSFIPEGDVYRLITHSKLPSSEKFEHWVFDEVLPCIRKHGGYMSESMVEQAMQKPEMLLLFARRMLEEHNRANTLAAELAMAKPKADYFDAFVNPKDCTNIRGTAKELDIPEKTLTQYLLRAGYMFRAPAGHLLPYAKPRNRELFIVRDYYNNGHLGEYTLFTPKGKDYFRLRREEILIVTA